MRTINTANELVISYLTLRRALGVLGILLPFVLALSKSIFFGDGLEDSISSYYHTGMRDVFVGIMCAVGLFLFSYRGYDLKDNVAGDVACIGAIGLALFPTPAAGDTSSVAQIIGGFHLFFTALFFLTLTFFSLFLFTRTAPNSTPTPRKRQRNVVYRVSGTTIFISIVLIGVVSILPHEIGAIIQPYNPVFWLESIGVVAFGISWLVKGEAILRDET